MNAGPQFVEIRLKSAGDLQVYGLRALATAIGFGVEADLLVFGQTRQARCLNGGDMDEDVRAAIVGLDEAKALVGIEEFYSASLGHASGPFLSARIRRGSIAMYPQAGERQAFVEIGGKGPCYRRLTPDDVTIPSSLTARGCYSVPGAHYFIGLPMLAKLPEHRKSAWFVGNWQAKVLTLSEARVLCFQCEQPDSHPAQGLSAPFWRKFASLAMEIG